jgi:hyperosmotically inducible periplasmic protein
MKTKLHSIGVAVCLGTAAALLSVTGCAGDRHKQSTGEYIDDKATSLRVKSALHDDVQYKYPQVEVKTFKGNCQLSGFVDTQEQKARAGDIAKRIEGVHNVENKITVNNPK